MIFEVWYGLIEAVRQQGIARAELERAKEEMRRRLERIDADEREHYGRDAIDVEAHEVPDTPLLPP